MSSIVARIMSYLPLEDEFERMKQCDSNAIGGVNGFDSYHDFRLFNKKCIEQLSFEAQTWVWGLCKRIDSKTVTTMDLEDCGQWTACGLFYNVDKKLCIIHPR